MVYFVIWLVGWPLTTMLLAWIAGRFDLNDWKPQDCTWLGMMWPVLPIYLMLIATALGLLFILEKLGDRMVNTRPILLFERVGRVFGWLGGLPQYFIRLGRRSRK